jgi:exosome complex component RRP45
MGFDYVSPFSSLASSGQGQGQSLAVDEGQKLLSNRILRIIERTLIQGGAIDAEALCVQSGKWVWRLMVDVTVLDHGGNLVDACVLSAVAALRHFRKPEVRVEGEDREGLTTVLHSDEREPTPLPLHHTPLTVTFGLFADPTGASTLVSALIDPSHREELVMDGTTTFGFNRYGEMCCLDFPGGCELKPRQLVTCANLGKRKCVELCDVLEKALSEADAKAVQERLDRLKLINGGFRQGQANGSGKRRDVILPDIAEDIPFVERTDLDRDAEMMEVDQQDVALDENQAAAIAAAEEESYRILALDYSQGHVAAKVRENDTARNMSARAASSRGGAKSGMFGGSLMEAMVKAAGKRTTKVARVVEENVSKSSSEQNTQSSLKDIQNDVSSSNEVSSSVDSIRSKVKPQQQGHATIMMDSDEEEEITTLQSEFVSLSKDEVNKVTDASPMHGPTETKVKTKVVIKDDDDEDVDDLMMAVKSTKSKKKKSKKK